MEFVGCFSHGKTGVVGYWEEDHRGKMSFSRYHIKDLCNQHDLWLLSPFFFFFDLWLLMLTLITCDVVFVRILHCKLLFVPFLYFLLRKEVTMHCPHLRRGKLCLPLGEQSIYINYLGFFHMGDLAFLHCLLIYLSIYVTMESWIFILYSGLYYYYYLFTV